MRARHDDAPCDNYTLDICATQFGQCQCGFAKASHSLGQTPKRRQSAAAALPTTPKTQPTVVPEKPPPVVTPPVVTPPGEALAKVLQSAELTPLRPTAARSPPHPPSAAPAAAAISSSLKSPATRSAATMQRAMSATATLATSPSMPLLVAPSPSDSPPMTPSFEPLSSAALLPATLAQWRAAAVARAERSARTASLARRALTHYRVASAVNSSTWQRRRSSTRALVHAFCCWCETARRWETSRLVAATRAEFSRRCCERQCTRAAVRMWLLLTMRWLAEIDHLWRRAATYRCRAQLTRGLCTWGALVCRQRRWEHIANRSRLGVSWRHVCCLLSAVRWWRAAVRRAAHAGLSGANRSGVAHAYWRVCQVLAAMRRWHRVAEHASQRCVPTHDGALLHSANACVFAFRIWARRSHARLVLRLAAYAYHAHRWRRGVDRWKDRTVGSRHVPAARIERRIERSRLAACLRKLRRRLLPAVHASRVAPARAASRARLGIAWSAWTAAATLAACSTFAAARHRRTKLEFAWALLVARVALGARIAAQQATAGLLCVRRTHAALRRGCGAWRALAVRRATGRRISDTAGRHWAHASTRAMLGRLGSYAAAEAAVAARLRASNGSRPREQRAWRAWAAVAASRRAVQMALRRGVSLRKQAHVGAAVSAWAAIAAFGRADRGRRSMAARHMSDAAACRVLQRWHMAAAEARRSLRLPFDPRLEPHVVEFALECRAAERAAACVAARMRRQHRGLQLGLTRWRRYAERRLRFAVWHGLQARFTPTVRSHAPTASSKNAAVAWAGDSASGHVHTAHPFSMLRAY